VVNVDKQMPSPLPEQSELCKVQIARIETQSDVG
jgi:hypothetical protein